MKILFPYNEHLIYHTIFCLFRTSFNIRNAFFVNIWSISISLHSPSNFNIISIQSMNVSIQNTSHNRPSSVTLQFSHFITKKIPQILRIFICPRRHWKHESNITTKRIIPKRKKICANHRKFFYVIWNNFMHKTCATLTGRLGRLYCWRPMKKSA